MLPKSRSQIPGQGSDPDCSIWSQAHLLWGHCTSLCRVVSDPWKIPCYLDFPMIGQYSLQICNFHTSPLSQSAPCCHNGSESWKQPSHCERLYISKHSCRRHLWVSPSTIRSRSVADLMKGSLNPWRALLLTHQLYLQLDKTRPQLTALFEQPYLPAQQAAQCEDNSGYTGSVFRHDQWSKIHPRLLLCQIFLRTWRVTSNLG